MGLLLKAVSAGRCRQVRTMLDSGHDAEQLDECKQTALIRAIFLEHSRRRENMVKLLLKYEAKTSSADAVGRNALTWACLYGHAKDVEFLLENADVDLDLNQVDMNGETALFHAATSGSAATVKLMVNALKKYILNLDIANFDGVTPLMQASRLGHDICAAIIQNGGGTVGVNSILTMEEEFDTAGKWAVKSQKTAQRSNNNKDKIKPNRNHPQRNVQSQMPPRFPPIISQAVLQKIKFRENRAVQQRVNTPVDSDDDSYYGSEVSYYTEKSFDSINSPIGGPSLLLEDDAMWRYRSDRLSIMSVSQTSSTEINLSSDDEASEKLRLEPTREPEDGVFQVTRNLPAFFRVYEELNSPSYRSPVTTRRQCPSSMESTSSDSAFGDISPAPRQTKSGRKKKNQQKVMELRKMLLRKQATKDIALQPQQFQNVTRETSVCSDTDSDSKIFNKKSILPRIIKSSPLVSDDNDNGDSIPGTNAKEINYSEN